MTSARGRGRDGRSGRGRGRGGRAISKSAAVHESTFKASAQPPSKYSFVSMERQPIFMARNMCIVEGKRFERRPSSIARKAGCRYSTQVLRADAFDVPGGGDWIGPEMMPNEADSTDLGWCPGPLERELPAFHGPSPGPTNPFLQADSTEIEIMEELITPAFKKRCHELTVAHVDAFRSTHPNRGRKCIEKAFGKQESFLSLDDNGHARFVELFDT